MARRCWTCSSEHDLDEPCRQFPQARAEKAAGGRVGPLFDGGGTESKPVVFPAGFDGECSGGDEILEGDLIRADSKGGWIHVECDDE